ncbi:hypothetical protein L3Q82_001833 [Scortum barcoo]|uniref:Uncharacterized protein n=1 Tax=Scortum barcoo TaxID=214431 RepID=A0ACB8W4R2_9TELE|nr:hypothetical protein L3Q82_001833 [Scortum barcoo]
MSDPKSEEALVRYYCTAGNGMERFLMDEVKVKLAAEDVCQMPGKVLFSSSARINRVSELKAAERLFLLLKQDAPVRLSAHTSPAKAASVLQSRLLGDADQWRKAVMTWSRLQGELAVRRSTVKAPSTARRVTWKEEEEEKCDVESRKSTEEQREESGDGRLRSDEQNGEYMLEKKKKTAKEQQEEVSKVIGVGLSRLLGWRAELKNPQLEAACFLGMDIDDGQLQRANENVEFAELGNRIHLLKASSMALPLPSASVDAVICDLPFGRKFGTKTNMATNLPLILTEMESPLFWWYPGSPPESSVILSAEKTAGTDRHWTDD